MLIWKFNFYLVEMFLTFSMENGKKYWLVLNHKKRYFSTLGDSSLDHSKFLISWKKKIPLKITLTRIIKIIFLIQKLIELFDISRPFLSKFSSKNSFITEIIWFVNLIRLTTIFSLIYWIMISKKSKSINTILCNKMY